MRGNVSLYSQYLTERTNDLILENDWGFATYRYMPENTVYIVDIFVSPKSRRQDLARTMADCIAAEARAKGCTSMIGTVVPSCKGSHASMLVLIAYGMKLESAGPDLIVFRKEL